MHIVDGHIRDANMNYVCAAGTGSFIEEQANKLGYKWPTWAKPCWDQAPARHRPLHCLMEQDVVRFIEAGASRPEALAAVMVAVAQKLPQQGRGQPPPQPQTHHVPRCHRAEQGAGGRV